MHGFTLENRPDARTTAGSTVVGLRSGGGNYGRGGGLEVALDRGFGELPPYITFYPAVVICSMLSGVGPGILTTLLGLFLADLLFIEPIGKLIVTHGADAVGMLLFAFFGMAISFIGGRLAPRQMPKRGGANRWPRPSPRKPPIFRPCSTSSTSAC